MEAEGKRPDDQPPERRGSGPLRLCCTCGVIVLVVVGLAAGYVYSLYRRAFDPAQARTALGERLAIEPPPGYQASFDGGPFGMTVVLVGPEGVHPRSPVPPGQLRMTLGVMPVDPAKSDETVQAELVEFLERHQSFQLQVQETREVPVVIRGQPASARESIGVVRQGGAPARLVSVVVPKDPAVPQGDRVLVGALGERDRFDQAAWEAFLASIR